MSKKPGIVSFLTFGLGIVGLGYGIMKGESIALRPSVFLMLIVLVTTPTDQQFYDSLSPELKRRVDLQRSAGDRQAAYVEQLKVSPVLPCTMRLIPPPASKGTRRRIASPNKISHVHYHLAMSFYSNTVYVIYDGRTSATLLLVRRVHHMPHSTCVQPLDVLWLHE